VEHFPPCVNTLRWLSLVGAAALDAVDQFHTGNLQVIRASPHPPLATHHLPTATTPSLAAHPALNPLPQDLINILNENASSIGLQLRRFKCPAPLTFIRLAPFDFLAPGPTDGALYVGLHSSQGQSRPDLRVTQTTAIYPLLFSSNWSSLLSAKVTHPPRPPHPPPLNCNTSTSSCARYEMTPFQTDEVHLLAAIIRCSSAASACRRPRLTPAAGKLHPCKIESSW
jgi:hypothetical protein